MAEFKVSGTGWFCLKINGEWAPIYKLTPEQLLQISCVAEFLEAA